MNFFQAQDKARGKTKQLILYFILALIGLYVSIYFLLWGLELLLLPESPHLNRYPSSLPPESCGLAQIDPALQQLLSTTPEWKKRILEACQKIAKADSQLNTTESSLLLTLQAIFEIDKNPLTLA